MQVIDILQLFVCLSVNVILGHKPFRTLLQKSFKGE